MIMDIKIQAVHFTADAKLIDFITGKVEKLNQYYDHIVSCEIFLLIDKASTVNNKIGEIKLHIPGAEFFAKKQGNSFEESIDTAVEAIRKQLTKRKEKLSEV
jgi:putative sigma-54 modulation protein